MVGKEAASNLTSTLHKIYCVSLNFYGKAFSLT